MNFTCQQEVIEKLLRQLQYQKIKSSKLELQNKVLTKENVLLKYQLSCCQPKTTSSSMSNKRSRLFNW